MYTHHVVSAGRGHLMSAEIAQQPQILAHLLDTGVTGILGVATQIRKANPRFVLLAARGTSDHAALYAKYLIEVELGLPCGLVSLSTMTGYAATPHLDDVLWVAISQSGGSPNLVESTRAARQGGALTVALTNAPGSALAAADDLHIDIQAGPEHSVAATKNYTAELLSIWLLVDAWRGRRRRKETACGHRPGARSKRRRNSRLQLPVRRAARHRRARVLLPNRS